MHTGTSVQAPQDRADCDLLVIGGGINGTGIALDAAGRGLGVCLCEMGDLAAATSSSSSKLVHGGLRYLEQYEFRLVRESLREREILLHKAPHIVWPLRFRMPHRPHLRPFWLIRLGLFLYDTLARRQTLPGACSLRFDHSSPLLPDMTHGFEYSDAWVDDARLVLLNAMAARELGAEILTRTRCTAAQRVGALWQITLQAGDGRVRTVTARALVNAAGPWASALFGSVLAQPAPRQIRLVQGSHIVVPRLHPGAEAYILQNEDRRIVFVLPWLERFSLIGTTDVACSGDPGAVQITPAETAYLLDVVNRHFRRQLQPADVVGSYAGVRPLVEDAAASLATVSRDYELVLDAPAGQAPLLSVFGGKLTTYRQLAETALQRLQRFFPGAGPAWTASSVLPGGDFADREVLLQTLLREYPWLPVAVVRRYARSYGTRTRQLLAGATAEVAMGQDFGAGLWQREVDYLCQWEWAQSAADILWRRTKLGWLLTPAQVAALERYLAARAATATATAEAASAAAPAPAPILAGTAGTAAVPATPV